MNDLVVLEKQLEPLAPRFAQALASIMPVERLIRTVLISVERQPQLLTCDRQSLFNAAMTFAVLGLEVDGATGQAYLVPFNDRRRGVTIAQPIIGYKGFNTLGARAGMTIAGGVVREEDAFDYAEGSKAFVHHKKKLGRERDRRIIAAWATATATDRPAIVKVLSIDEILAIKQKSPRGKEPPWADPEIGFPAMSEKSAKRRLARDMPLNVFQLAARLDEAFEEQGKPAWIAPDRNLVVDGEIIAPKHSSETPSAETLIAPPKTAADWDFYLVDNARCGTEALAAAWQTVPRDMKAVLKPMLETKHKHIAAKADKRTPAAPASASAAGVEPLTTSQSPPSTSQARGGDNQQRPVSATATSFLSPDDKIALAHQRGRDDRAKGVKRSATPMEYRAPDRTAEAFAWVEGWNEKGAV